MGIEVSGERARCFRCGTDYSRFKGYFPVSYAILHKGVGYIPVCKECIDNIYDGYLAQCNNVKYAVRQTCRKLDLYWSESVFKTVAKKSTTRTMMMQYIAKINSLTYAGKSYDNTLSEEGTLWDFIKDGESAEISKPLGEESDEQNDISDVPEETLNFWGTDYTRSMYDILEKKYAYYKSKIAPDSDIDIGTERLIRQVCILEATIDRDSAAGKSVEKSVNTYNTLIGSLKLKPTQKNDIEAANDNTPFGVWIHRWETMRPVPEPDPELKDVDGIIRYISIWFFGHLCKMLGIKNIYCKLYEDEIAKRRVEHPEYEDEDDEQVFDSVFAADSEGDNE